jgi:NAD(P)H dehydrogenase (quinone)
VTCSLYFLIRQKTVFAAPFWQLLSKNWQRKDMSWNVLDLYADGFNPVLSKSEWLLYEKHNNAEIQRYADQILDTDGLIWIFPTWNYGFPAVLKGYVDRIWKPNVAFRIDRSRGIHFDSFGNLKFFLVITTYGASRLANMFLGNPSKRTATRGLRRHLPLSCGFAWRALYRMDKPAPRRLNRFLANVRQTARDYSTRFAGPPQKVERQVHIFFEWIKRNVPI